MQERRHKEHERFGTAGGGEVAEVLDPCGRPAQVAKETSDDGLCVRIVSEYVQWIRLDQPSVPEELRYWHSSWLPLATDGCGDSLFVETARGEGFGRIGRHSHGDGGRFDNQLQYASLDALLSWAAQALADGSTTDLLDYVITVGEDGFPYWEDADAQGDEVSVVWDMKVLKNRYGPL